MTESQIKADWNAGDEFCKFIIEIERSAFKARQLISDGIFNDNAKFAAKCMDDWYESLQNIYDKVCGFMDDTTELDKLEEQIKKITDGDYFTNSNLESENLRHALELIRKYGREMSKFLAVAGIYMKTDVKINYKNFQEEIDAQYAD